MAVAIRFTHLLRFESWTGRLAPWGGKKNGGTGIAPRAANDPT
jgi:hypothetical protein